MQLLTNDDPQLARPVADLIEASADCFVPSRVVLELEWVLRGAYQLPREAIIRAVRGLMAIRRLHLEHEEQLLQALDADGHAVDFADALHLLRSEGCSVLVTFDRAFARQAAELSLSPPVEQP